MAKLERCEVSGVKFVQFEKVKTQQPACLIHHDRSSLKHFTPPPQVTSWDDLATTKALLKQDGLDYDSLVLKGVMGGQENAVLEKRDYVKKVFF